MSLKQQTINGLFWSVIELFLFKGVTLISGLYLARLLGPEEFGLIGMITIFMSLGLTMIDSGMSSSIIRTINTDYKDYNTVFYANLFFSIIIYLIIFLTSPFISKFYNQPILIDLIRVYSISFIISALSSIQLALLNKELKFRKILLLNLPGIMFGVIVGVLMGNSGFGVWSIVAMHLVTLITQTLLLWFYSTWKPRLFFSVTRLKLHYSFGYKLMLSGIIDTIFKNSYNVIIGKFFSLSTLGLYERANSLTEYPISAVTNIINRVSYPLLSKIQEQKDQVEIVYKKLIQFSFFIMAPLMLGFLVLSKPIIILLLGNKWTESIPFIQVFCLTGVMYPIHSLNINILKVYGRSDLFLKLELLKKTIMVISIIISFQFGLLVFVWSNFFTSLLSLGINIKYSKDLINYSILSQIRDLFPTLIISILMAIIMKVVLNNIYSLSFLIQIILTMFIGSIFYLFANYIIKATPLIFVKNLIINKNI